LIASAVAQSFNGYLLPILSNRDQDRLVIISKTSGETRMLAKCKTREELTGPTQHWPLMLLAERLNGAVQHLRRDAQAQVVRYSRTNLRQRVLGSLSLQRRFLATL
jgi:hypothetical protein